MDERDYRIDRYFRIALTAALAVMALAMLGVAISLTVGA